MEKNQDQTTDAHTNAVQYTNPPTRNDGTQTPINAAGETDTGPTGQNSRKGFDLDTKTLVNDTKQALDELRVQVNLLGKEARDKGQEGWQETQKLRQNLETKMRGYERLVSEAFDAAGKTSANLRDDLRDGLHNAKTDIDAAVTKAKRRLGR